MNKIWGTIILISALYGLVTGRGVEMANQILNIPKETVSLGITIIGSAIFWSGIMKIFENAGTIDKVSQFLTPIMKKIMPKLKDQEALNYISINMAANLFGLGFAATPSGLKGIKRLKEISPLPEGVASDDMITFLVLNTAGVTIIPTSVLAIRQALGSKHPGDFMLIGLIGTVLSCVGGLLADKLFRRPYYER